MQSGFIIGALAWVALAGSLASAQSTPNFTIAAYDVGSTPVQLASGYFNADTNLDLAVVNNDSGDVSILYGSVDGTFTDSGASVPVGTAPSAIAVADFNGDGTPDIVVTDELDSNVSVLLNQGGVFATPLTAATGSSPEAVVVGDFNGDHVPDIATADEFDDQVSIFLGSCTAGVGACDTFALPPGQPIHVGTAPVALVALDLDGDGNLDLVVVNSSGGPDAAGTLTVLKGVGNGTFIAQPEIGSALFNVPVAIATADFNGDGKPDLAIANQQGDPLHPTTDTAVVLLGDAIADCNNNHTVTPDELLTMVDIALGHQPVSACTAGDADNSGDITVNEIIRGVNRALNGITFQILAPALTVGGFPSGIVAADFNGDGKADIATSNTFDDTISVLVGAGDGTFSPKVDFNLKSTPDELVGPLGLIAGDFNGDQQVDIASANQDDNTVSVLLNATTALIK